MREYITSMIFDWKIIATLIVVFIALAVIIGTSTPVGNFFASIKEKFNIGPIVNTNSKGSIEFYLTWDNYSDVVIDNKQTLNITVNSENFVASIGIGNLNLTEKTVSIVNFKGTGNITGNEVKLDGKYSKIIIEGFGEFYNGTIKASGLFNEMSVENPTFAKLVIEGSGAISYKGNELSINNQTAELTSVSGAFVFGNGLGINGTASSIKVGEIVIK